MADGAELGAPSWERRALFPDLFSNLYVRVLPNHTSSEQLLGTCDSSGPALGSNVRICCSVFSTNLLPAALHLETIKVSISIRVNLEFKVLRLRCRDTESELN